MESAPLLCTALVQELRKALGGVDKVVRTFLQFHTLGLAPYAHNVRKMLINSMNLGLD